MIAWFELFQFSILQIIAQRCTFSHLKDHWPTDVCKSRITLMQIYTNIIWYTSIYIYMHKKTIRTHNCLYVLWIYAYVHISGLFKLFLGSSLNSIISKPEIGWRRGNKKLWASGARRCTSAIAMESPGGTQPHTHTHEGSNVLAMGYDSASL